jgi:type IV pilus assembly protein PilC
MLNAPLNDNEIRFFAALSTLLWALLWVTQKAYTNMQTFTCIYRWKGVSQEGIFLQGELESANWYLAKAQLLHLNIHILQIMKKRFAFQLKKILTPALRIQFTEQLADLISAGLPLTDALIIVMKAFSDARAKTLFWFIHHAIEKGQSFGTVLHHFTRDFNVIYRQLIEMGEALGALEKVLYRLAAMEKKKILMLQKFQKATFYPAIVLILAVVVSGFLLVGIMPKFIEVFNQSSVSLPWITQVFINLSHFFIHYGWLIVIFLFGGLVSYGYLLKTSKTLQKNTLKSLLKLPGIGKIINAFYLVHFSYGLSTLLQVGIPTLPALETLTKQVTHPLYAESMQIVLSAIKQGNALSRALTDVSFFPSFFIDTLQVGEASGLTAQSLLKLATFYETTIDRFLEGASIFLEPILMVTLGLIIGLFMIALYLPLFNLGNAMQV